MRYLVVDIETTITPKEGWQPGESLLKGGVSLPYNSNSHIVAIGFKGTDYPARALYPKYEGASFYLPATPDLLVGFNLKFDLSWLREADCPFAMTENIWDCQIVEYLLSGSTMIMPSLNLVAEKYGLGQKHDKVKEMWESGINTDEIPEDILTEYLLQDVLLTEQIFFKQYKLVTGHEFV